MTTLYGFLLVAVSAAVMGAALWAGYVGLRLLVRELSSDPGSSSPE